MLCSTKVTHFFDLSSQNSAGAVGAALQMVSLSAQPEEMQAVRDLLAGLVEDRAFVLETYKQDRLRTVGTGYILPPEWDRLSDWDATDASALTRMFDRQTGNSLASARGKLILIQPATMGRKPALICYQTKGKDVSHAFCGNATAAGAVIHAHLTGGDAVSFEVTDGNRSAQVYAQVDLNDVGACVDQSWEIGEQVIAEEIKFQGQRAVRCSLLNDYLILAEPLPFDPVTVLQSPDSPVKGIGAKLAVIEKCWHVSRVRFFNCNGQHRAAPQTGLATLTFAALRIPWVGEMLGGGAVQHPGGIDALPTVESLGDGTVSVAMPKVEVRLWPLLGSSLSRLK